MSHIAAHVAWWMRRFPSARPHRDDIAQEAALAAWLAESDFDESRGAKLSTFAWKRMYGAVRSYLRQAGVLRFMHTKHIRIHEAVELTPLDEPGVDGGAEAAVIAGEAWGDLVAGYVSRGLAQHHAEALARLDLGQTFAEAGAAVGISKQAVHQVARRAGVHGTYSREASA